MFLWSSKKNKYQERREGAKPNILLMHYTGMKTMEEAMERLSGKDAEVSAHYLIDEDGAIHDLVPEQYRAWHAGVSYWKGVTDINSYSIGVEIVNPGHEWGYRPFPAEQMESVLELAKRICNRHDIKYVLAHSDVAPERKKDPGEFFDWRRLADNGVGVWPDPSKEQYEQAEKIAVCDYETEKLFVQYGYNPASAYVDIITAFHRHYFPEKFVEGKEGEVCLESVARLLSLIHQSKQL